MPSRSRNSGRGSRGSGGASGFTRRDYPRSARVNEVLREIVAEALEEIDEPDLHMVTVTGVSADPDLRHATVWFSALTGASGVAGAKVALAAHRVALQAAIGREVRFKRTPMLQFEADPAITEGQRIEDVIRTMPRSPEEPKETETATAPDVV